MLKRNHLTHILAFSAFIIWANCFVFGQSMNVTLKFVEDTMAIGRPVGLKMSIEHPADVVVVFPERTEDFYPFELVNRLPQPTSTEGSRSLDVVTYEVRSFELYPKQAVRLPYLYLTNGDTIRKEITSDSILLIERIPVLSDQLPYKINQGVISLQDPPNYMLIFSIVFGSIAVIIVAGLLLRKPILRYIALRKVSQEWEAIKKKLSNLERHTDQKYVLEELNQIWKTSLDPTDSLALRTKTTTELKKDIFQLEHFTIEHHNILVNASKVGDSVIYAGKKLDHTELGTVIRQVKQVLGIAYVRRQNDLKGITYGSAI